MTDSSNRLSKTANEYHANPDVPDIHIENIYQEHFNQWLLAQISPGSRVLEMGYGDGIVTAALAGAGHTLTVLEGAAVLAERAQSAHCEVRVVHALFEDFEPSTPFDFIVASHVLEHVDDPRATLRRMTRWLTDKGRIIAAVPNRNSLHRQLAVMMGLQPALESLSKRDILVGHQRVYSPATLEADIRSAGLDIILTGGFFLKVVPNSMMLDYSRELLHALNEISPRVPTDLLANIAVVAAKAR